MAPISFETKLIDNNIKIPEDFQRKLELSKDKHVRIIVMIEELEINAEIEIKKLLNNQFLIGYAEVDDIYDNL